MLLRSSKYNRAYCTPPLNRWSPPQPDFVIEAELSNCHRRFGFVSYRCAALKALFVPESSMRIAVGRTSGWYEYVVVPFITLNDDSNTSLLWMPVYFACVDEAGFVWTSEAASSALNEPSRRWPRILLFQLYESVNF